MKNLKIINEHLDYNPYRNNNLKQLKEEFLTIYEDQNVMLYERENKGDEWECLGMLRKDISLDKTIKKSKEEWTE